nr:uncharacterized protein LOC105884259 [Microcebus murinus]
MKPKYPHGENYGSSLAEDIQADTSRYLERTLVCLVQAPGHRHSPPQGAALEQSCWSQGRGMGQPQWPGLIGSVSVCLKGPTAEALHLSRLSHTQGSRDDVSGFVDPGLALQDDR